VKALLSRVETLEGEGERCFWLTVRPFFWRYRL